MQAKYEALQSAHLVYDAERISPPLEPLFDREQLRQQSTSNSLGRGAALIFHYQGLHLVLKHYQRGGAIRHLVRDSYHFKSLETTRMWREFHLLAHMRELGLPVPNPIAARCDRSSPLVYRGDLITEVIPNACTLAEHLARQPLSGEDWQSLGRTIALFHYHNVYHADLNANNIMLNEQRRVFLIDFDKSELRQSDKAGWSQANLARLLRSLQKLKTHSQLTHFGAKDWQCLEQGYRGD